MQKANKHIVSLKHTHTYHYGSIKYIILSLPKKFPYITKMI